MRIATSMRVIDSMTMSAPFSRAFLVGLAPPSLLGPGSRHSHGINYRFPPGSVLQIDSGPLQNASMDISQTWRHHNAQYSEGEILMKIHIARLVAAFWLLVLSLTSLTLAQTPDQTNPPASSNVTTTGGTVNAIPLFTTATIFRAHPYSDRNKRASMSLANRIHRSACRRNVGRSRRVRLIWRLCQGQ